MLSKETKELLTRVYTAGYKRGHNDTVEGTYADVLWSERNTYFLDDVQELMDVIGVHPDQMPLNLPNPNTGD